jgi:phosphate-selective porin OprO/OprP
VKSKGAIALRKGVSPTAVQIIFLCIVVIGCGLRRVPADTIDVASAETNASVAISTPPSESEEGVKGVTRRPKEDFQIKLQTNAPPEAGGVTNLPAAVDYGFHWDVSWEGWNGLHLGISQRTPLTSPREMLGLKPLSNAPTMHLEQLQMSARIGGVLEVDAAAFHTTDNLDLADNVQLRRARLKAEGDCILLFPVSYKIELGYIPHRFNLNEAWISSDRIDYIGYLVAGVFQPPMGLDLMTSSRDLTFMEPATVLQALAPANEAGIQIGHPVFDQRATWALGIFGGGVTTTEYGNASQNYGNLIGRFTCLAIDHLAPPDRPAENRYLHLGFSANFQYSASSTVRYQSRPESYIAKQVIDTGNIDASGSGELAAETAYVNGPFSVQSEFIDSFVRQNDGEGLNFYGFYVNASWYLTGESRPYDRTNGDFKRLVPRRNFDFGKDGAWGAFEVAARFSYTDLDDGNISGGKISLLMGELNWYLQSHVRWMFNAGGGRITGGINDGNILLFQTRVGMDF